MVAKIILTVFAAVILYKLFRFIIKRLSLTHRIKRVCRRMNYELIPTAPLATFGTQLGSHCDFYIKTPRETYSVKLIASPERTRRYVFNETGSYRAEKLIMLFSRFDTCLFTIPLGFRTMREFDYTYDPRDLWRINRVKPILLFNPAPIESAYISAGQRRDLVSGDTLYGARLYSGRRFLELLKAGEEPGSSPRR